MMEKLETIGLGIVLVLILWWVAESVIRRLDRLTFRPIETHMKVAGRPVFLSRQLLDNAVKLAYPPSLQPSARVSLLIREDARKSEHQQTLRKIRAALTRFSQEEPDAFEASMVRFCFDGEEAQRECRNLLVAWAEYSGAAYAVGASEKLGLISRKRRGLQVLLNKHDVARIEGTMDQCVIVLSKGQVLVLSSTLATMDADRVDQDVPS